MKQQLQFEIEPLKLSHFEYEKPKVKTICPICHHYNIHTRECKSLRRRIYQNNHPSRAKWRAENKDKLRAYNRKHYAKVKLLMAIQSKQI